MTLEFLDIATEFFNAFGIGVEVAMEEEEEEEEEQEEDRLICVMGNSEVAAAIGAALVDISKGSLTDDSRTSRIDSGLSNRRYS